MVGVLLHWIVGFFIIPSHIPLLHPSGPLFYVPTQPVWTFPPPKKNGLSVSYLVAEIIGPNWTIQKSLLVEGFRQVLVEKIMIYIPSQWWNYLFGIGPYWLEKLGGNECKLPECGACVPSWNCFCTLSCSNVPDWGKCLWSKIQCCQLLVISYTMCFPVMSN